MSKKIGKKIEWKETDKRFVAFLDIMGFKDRVMRDEHTSVLNLLLEITNFGENINQMKSLYPKYKEAELGLSIFSDTIFIYSNNDQPDTFHLFLAAVRNVMASSIDQCVPIKGAIAYGDLTVMNNVVIGKPIIDASILHDDINYYGVVYHHTVDRYKKDNNLANDQLECFVDVTTMKSGNITHTNLIWFRHLEFFDDQKRSNYQEILQEKLEEIAFSVSGAPRKYIDNTLLMWDKLKQVNSLFSA